MLDKLEKSKEFWFVFITSIFFFLLRLPSLFEPNWYGDEGIYQVIGRGLNQGRLLYTGIWDNKPPLLYIVYQIFNSDQFLVRLASLAAGILAVIAFFYLAKELFKNKNKAIYISTAVFAFLFGIPLIEGNIANAENFMLAPIIFSAYIIFSKNHEEKDLSYFLTFFFPGLLLGIAFLFKIVAVFDFASFFCFIFIVHFGTKKIGKIISMLIPFVIGFFSPIFITLLFFISKGSLSDFVHAALIQNVGYVGYSNKFIIPQGFLILKLIILAAVVLLLFFKKRNFKNPAIFIISWVSFSLFDTFFSGRPYTHYVLMTLPAFCLLLGLWIYGKKLRTSLILAIVTFLLVKNFNYFGKSILYYQNFISFITNNKSVNDYRTFFDSHTPVDYEIADYLKLHLSKNDTFFLWGNDAQLYVLADRLPPGKYTVAYHMNFSKETILETGKALQKENPKFVVISDNTPFPFSLLGYKQVMAIDSSSIYERSF